MGVRKGLLKTYDLPGPLAELGTLLLGVLLISSAIHEGWNDTDQRDEDVKECSCKKRDKSLYIGSLAAVIVLWVMVVLYVYGVDYSEIIAKAIRKLCKKCGIQFEAIRNVDSESYQPIGPPVKQEWLTLKNGKECFFVVLRFAATIALIPLVYMQTLDTYEWICISGKTFCKTPERRSRLFVLKASITMAFLLCAFIISDINLESKKKTLYTAFKKQENKLERIN